MLDPSSEFRDEGSALAIWNDGLTTIKLNGYVSMIVRTIVSHAGAMGWKASTVA